MLLIGKFADFRKARLRHTNDGLHKQSISIVDDILIMRALLLRYVRLRFIRQPTGVFSEFFRPTVVCVVHYFMFLAVSRQFPNGLSVEQAIWSAFPVWFTFSRVYNDVQMPHLVSVPQFRGTTRMHLRLAICVWAMAVNATFCYGSVWTMQVFGDNIAFPNTILTAFIFMLAAILGFGLGLTVEALGRTMPFLHGVFHVLPYLLFISAGLYFSAAMSPIVLVSVFLYSPLLHIIEYERYAFDPGYPIALVSLWYPTLFAVGLVLTGLAANRRFRYLRHA